MNFFSYFVLFIIFIKVLFIISSVIHLYYKLKKNENNVINIKALYWRERFEFIFIFCMAVVLIYLFNPRYNNEKLINNEVKLLLYLFGFILLITAKWQDFIYESKAFEYLQKSLGN